MLHSLKKTVLALIGILLLFNFQVSSVADFAHEKSAIFDTSENDESSETEIENCELEKLFTHESVNFKVLKLSSRFTKRDHFLLQENFLEVPTSPPNA